MAKTLLFVEGTPIPQEVSAYHAWHEETHIPEMLGIEGFVAARRWQPEGTATFITLYEVDADVDTAKANLKAAYASGTMSKPVGVDPDNPAVLRYLSLIGEASR